MKSEIQKICGSALFDEPMARYTTVRVGGPADALLYPQTIEELSSLVIFAKKEKLPVFILGAGSNLLVRDKGLRGLVINLSRGFGRVTLESEDKDFSTVLVEAGVGLPKLVEWAAEEGFTGIEALTGIPANVGGALMMNAGTPDGDISKVVQDVSFMDKDGRLLTWEKAKIKFSYRESHFPKGSILLSTRLCLARKSSELVRGQVQKYRAMRIETQPLNVPSLGSVFKNPETPKGKKALFAGQLIDETGLKDIRVGGARISSKHGNWIVNENKATAKDVLALIGLARDKVKEKFGILLELEVKLVGEE